MEPATLSVRLRRANSRSQPLSDQATRLPVLLADAPSPLREALESEFTQGPLSASFFALADGAATRGPLVRVQRANELDTDVEVSAEIGSSQVARHAVFQLVQALVARSQRVRVCFLVQTARAAKARF